MTDLATNDISSTVAYNKIALIANGASLSNFCDIGGLKLSGLFIPSNFVGSTITFKVSPDDSNQSSNKGNFLLDDGTLYTVQVAAAGGGDQLVYVELPIAKFPGIKYIALLAGSTQTSDVNIILACTLV